MSAALLLLAGKQKPAGAASISDDFSGTFPTASDAGTWSTAGAGTWSNTSGKLHCVDPTGTPSQFAFRTAPAADGTYKITLTTSVANQGRPCALLRYVDINNFIVIQHRFDTDQKFYMFKNVAGTLTQVDSGSVAFSSEINAQVVTVVLAGTSLAVSVTSTAYPTATDPFSGAQTVTQLTTATKFGAANLSGGDPTQQQFDDFSFVP